MHCGTCPQIEDDPAPLVHVRDQSLWGRCQPGVVNHQMSTVARRHQSPVVLTIARRLDDRPPSLAGRQPPLPWAVTDSNTWYTMFDLLVCFLHVGVCVCRLAGAILREGNEEQLHVLFHFIWWKYGRELGCEV